MIGAGRRRLEGAGGWIIRQQVIPLALIVMMATVFFFGSNLPRSLFSFVVLPLAGLALFGPARRFVGMSFVLCACAIYLAAMFAASLLGPDGTDKLIFRQFEMSLMIIAFLLIVGCVVNAHPDFVDRFFSFAGAAVAVSATLNIWLYFRDLAPEGVSVMYYRLVASIGMPGYTNSTNISATYAVFCVGALATSLRPAVSPSWRWLAGAAAAILLAGVLLTQARSALLALCVGAGIIVLLRPGGRYFAGSAAAIMAILLLARPDLLEALVHRGFSQRPEVWSGFIDLILDRPWTGYGSFSPAGVWLGTMFLDQAHNLVLSGWFRGGILAAVAMAFILAGGIGWSFVYWRKTGIEAPHAVMATITVAGMFDYQLMITAPTWPWVTFWLPFGLAIGAEMTVRRLGTGAAAGGGAHEETSRPAKREPGATGTETGT